MKMFLLITMDGRRKERKKIVVVRSTTKSGLRRRRRRRRRRKTREEARQTSTSFCLVFSSFRCEEDIFSSHDLTTRQAHSAQTQDDERNSRERSFFSRGEKKKVLQNAALVHKKTVVWW